MELLDADTGETARIFKGRRNWLGRSQVAKFDTEDRNKVGDGGHGL